MKRMFSLKYFVVNIYFLFLLSLALTVVIPFTNIQSNVLEKAFYFSFYHIRHGNLWSFFTFPFLIHPIFGFIVLPLFYVIINRLKCYYSFYELGKFFILSGFCGAVFHLFLNANQVIFGSFPILIGFIILYCQIQGHRVILKLGKKEINWNILAFLLIALSYLSLGWKLPFIHSSFGYQTGVIIFVFLYKWAQKAKVLDFSYVPAENASGEVKSGKRIFFQISPEDKIESACNMDHEVDRILDKISEKGIHSLTEKEKAFLKSVSKKKV